jgi:hypothetical protein
VLFVLPILFQQNVIVFCKVILVGPFFLKPFNVAFVVVDIVFESCGPLITPDLD